MPNTLYPSTQAAEVIEGSVYTLDELAHACGVTQAWVLARVEAEILHVEKTGSVLRFDCATLIRARRVAQLETTFDADPQLAAMTADLIEEVAHLRKLLKALKP